MSSFDEIQNREVGLHKKLSAKQMGMIAIGGAIGTGLFMGSKFAISFAGPAVIVSYAIGGLIAFAIMACLAEMTVQHPTSGSFGAYAEHYVSPLAGFLVRYCYWACIVLAVGTEITAVADYMKLWFPDVGSWVWIGVIISIFSYLSIEMIAVAAGEAKDPERAVKKAFKSTAIRLILFYLLSLFLIVALVPWTTLIGADATSPFVMVMKIVGIPYADSILNFIVIVAALSAMNSMLYISTRMLFSLSRAGDAPKLFGRISHNGVPINALLLSAVGIGIASIVYTINPNSAFPIMIALSMFGALFTWGSIFITHMFFRRNMARKGEQLKFKVPASQLISLLGLIAILSITVTTWFTNEFKSTLQFGVPLVVVLTFFYYLKRSSAKLALNAHEESLK